MSNTTNNTEIQKKETKEKKHPLKIILLILFFAAMISGIVYCAYHLIVIRNKYQASADKVHAVADVFYAENDSLTTEMMNEEVQIGEENTIENFEGGFNLQPLIDLNEDTIGWIKIDDTDVDYPVMKHKTESDFYMHRDFDKNYDFSGLPFIPVENTIGGKWQNYIIYGHHMANGTMFGDLTEFLDEEFMKAHPTFTLVLRVGDEDVLYKCEIFSIHNATTREAIWVPFFPSAAEMDIYIDQMKQASAIPLDVDVSSDDTIVTLSTCHRGYDYEEGRFLVHAKLTKIIGRKIDTNTTTNTEDSAK